jgi:hypothetical protein
MRSELTVKVRFVKYANDPMNQPEGVELAKVNQVFSVDSEADNFDLNCILSDYLPSNPEAATAEVYYFHSTTRFKFLAFYKAGIPTLVPLADLPCNDLLLVHVSLANGGPTRVKERRFREVHGYLENYNRMLKKYSKNEACWIIGLSPHSLNHYQDKFRFLLKGDIKGFWKSNARMREVIERAKMRKEDNYRIVHESP